MIDVDILKRKLDLKGYLAPCNEKNKLTCYKLTTMAKQDFTIESTNLLTTPIQVCITKFVPSEEKPGCYDEVTVAEITCKSPADFDDAIKNIDNLENGRPSSPFDRLLNDTNMIFVKKKNGWAVA